MLCFAVEHCRAIESVMSDCKNDLRQFELDEDEWLIVNQLKNTLKVRDIPHDVSLPSFRCCAPDLEGHNIVFLAWNAQSHNRDPCNGSY
jgi:hypothetical protein